MYTEIAMVMDRSGSMQNIARAMEGGIKEFFEGQKKVPGRVLCSLYQFDELYEPVFEGKLISEVGDIKLEPRGWTALNDAIGKTVNAMGDRFSKMSKEARPGKVVVCIVTDGHENASREFTGEMVREIIQHQREVYNWEFVFLGTTELSIKYAEQTIQIPAGNIMRYADTPVGSGASLRAASANVASYASGEKASGGFLSSQREEQEELISKLKQ